MVIAMLPVVFEIIFDQTLWKSGVDDKPVSTYVRGAMILIIAILFQVFGINTWWQGAILLTGTHFMFFDYLLNVSRGKKITYHSEREYLYKFPWIGELFTKLVCFYSSWAIFFHLDWVYGNYPDRFIEFFKF